MVINPDENFSYKRLLLSVGNSDVDKHVARNFNTASHSISDIKICAISPISCGKIKDRKRVFFFSENILIKICLLQSINVLTFHAGSRHSNHVACRVAYAPSIGI